MFTAESISALETLLVLNWQRTITEPFITSQALQTLLLLCCQETRGKQPDCSLLCLSPLQGSSVLLLNFVTRDLITQETGSLIHREEVLSCSYSCLLITDFFIPRSLKRVGFN